MFSCDRRSRTGDRQPSAEAQRDRVSAELIANLLGGLDKSSGHRWISGAVEPVLRCCGVEREPQTRRPGRDGDRDRGDAFFALLAIDGVATLTDARQLGLQVG